MSDAKRDKASRKIQRAYSSYRDRTIFLYLKAALCRAVLPSCRFGCTATTNCILGAAGASSEHRASPSNQPWRIVFYERPNNEGQGSIEVSGTNATP